MEVVANVLRASSQHLGKEIHPLAGMVVADHQHRAPRLWHDVRVWSCRVALQADAGGHVRHGHFAEHLLAALSRRLRDANQHVRPLEATPQTPEVEPADQASSPRPFLHRTVGQRDDAGCEDEEIVNDDGLLHVPWNAARHKVGLLLVGHQQHELATLACALLQALAHATWVKPPPAEQARRAAAPERMVNLGAEAPAFHFVAGEQTHHASVRRAQTGVSTEGSASNDKHPPVHAGSPARTGFKVAPVKVHLQHQIQTVDRSIAVERHAKPAPRPFVWRHG